MKKIKAPADCDLPELFVLVSLRIPRPIDLQKEAKD